MTVKKLQQLTGHNAAVYAIAEGTSSEKIFSGGGEGWIVEWDLSKPNTGKLIATVPDSIFSLYFDAAAQTIYAGDKSGGLHTIGTDALRMVTYQKNHRKGIYQIFSDGKDLFTCGGDGVLTRYIGKNLENYESIQLSQKSLRSICLLADAVLCVGASDGNIYFLEKNTLELLYTRKNAHADSVLSLAAQDNFLVSGGKDAHLKIWTSDFGRWKLDVGKNTLDFGLWTLDKEQNITREEYIFPKSDVQRPMFNFQSPTSEIAAHLSAIYAIAFHLTEKKIFATASRDKTIKIWEINLESESPENTFQLLKVINTIKNGGHIRSVNNLMWRNDGTLVSVGDDSTLIVWDINSQVIKPKL